jgi:hypothetical protein
MTPIVLSDDDALKFVAFQKHYDLFTIMQSAGVFNIGYGKAIINIAGNVVQNIVVEEVKWKR